MSITDRAVAVASLLLALSTLVALVLVVGVTDAGVLETTALALAVIAFVAQLIVFIVQTTAANAQELRSQQLFASMQNVLGQLDERSVGTHDAIRDINEKMLDRIVAQAFSETVKSGTAQSSPQFAEAVRDRVSMLATADTDDERVPVSRRAHADRDLALLRYMRTFPATAEANDMVTALRSMSAPERAYLAALVNDELIYRQPTKFLEPGLLLDEDRPGHLLEGLVERGYAQVAGTDGHPYAVLTDAGREFARLLHGEPYPEGLLGDLEPLREGIADVGYVPSGVSPA